MQPGEKVSCVKVMDPKGYGAAGVNHLMDHWSSSGGKVWDTKEPEDYPCQGPLRRGRKLWP